MTLTEDEVVGLIEARTAGTDALIAYVTELVNAHRLEAVVMESIAQDPLVWEQAATE